MSGYAPLFGSLTTGTLCGRWPDIGLWPIVLSLADRHGVIDVTHDYLARITGLPLVDVVAVMDRFCQPDPYSRSSADEGRRLRLIDPLRKWGWVVVNHSHYREKARLMSRDSQRTATGEDAERKRNQRSASHNVPVSPPPSPEVPLSYKTHTRLRQNTNKTTEQNKNKTKEAALAAASAVVGLNLNAFEKWIAYRKDIAKPIKPASLEACAKELAKFGAQQIEVVSHSMANSYQGLFAPKQSSKPPPQFAQSRPRREFPA